VARADASPSTGILKGDSTPREAQPLAGRPEATPKEGKEDQDRPAEPEARAEGQGRQGQANEAQVQGLRAGLEGAVEAARVAAINRLFAPASLQGLAAARAGRVDRLFTLPSTNLSPVEDNLPSKPGQVAAGRTAQPGEAGGPSLTTRRVLAGTAIFVALAAPPLYETVRRIREGAEVG
jgi:hypothetical protein